MCGTSGGGIGTVPSAARLTNRLHQVVSDQERSEYKAQVNDFLAEVLREANVRDADATNRHLETVRQALQGLLEDSIELRFGGSVSKHTYVDGLSDVDLLVVLSRDTAVDSSPKDLIADFANALHERLPNSDVETGAMSVKVRFGDGTELQLLPAFKVGDGFRIPRFRGETWSDVIRPREFAARLSEVNQRNAAKVVPVVKLYKIAQERMPEATRLTGYHVEAIAVDAFKDYSGSLEQREMFLHLARTASRVTESPLVETTGQATYVDTYLGPAGSAERIRGSENIKRMVTRLERANERCELNDWYEAFSG